MRLFPIRFATDQASPNHRGISLVAMAGLLSGCVSTQVDVSQLDASASTTSPAVVSAFRSLCMATGSAPENVADRALSGGWIEASDEDLAAAGLEKLRKQVLEIPGGGAEISEEQALFARTVDGETTILAAERKRARTQTRSTTCSVYNRAAFLPTCEAVGQKIGKAPDHNQIYGQTRGESEAHFIRWRVMLEDKPAVVSCERAPSSRTLPYDGTVLSLRVDYTAKGAKRADASRTTQPKGSN